MARARTTYNRRTVSQSEQRELFEIGQEQRQYEQQRAFEFDRSEGLDGPVRRFQIVKSTPLGLVFPQNVSFSVKDVDAGIAHTGHIFNLSNSEDEPVFVTSELKWWKQKYILPPSFEVFPGAVHEHAWSKDRREELLGSEITGLPSTPPHDSLARNSGSSDGLTNPREQKPYPLAKIQYKGWQGLTRMSIFLTLYNITPEMHYHNEYSHNLTESVHSTPDIRSQYTINRTGWKREYVLTPSGHRWRAPSASEKKAILSEEVVDDASPIGHGNLILQDSEGRIVAVYKQRRDHKVLGSLTVFTKYVTDPKPNARNGQEGKITIEAVVASGLAVVVYERVGWQNLLGH